ncbi:hypothetical protein [Enterococcus cecorum]|uniref:hypothetical protein n=1 Tax=Enterococcus cecorum TaxID=44008 RepID=UPI00148BB026|nr:hypothetical protein [Enterococcus cecorum]
MQFTPKLKQVAIKSDSTTITLEVKDNSLSGQYDEIKKLTGSVINVMFVPEEYEYEIKVDEQNNPIEEFVIEPNGKTRVDLMQQGSLLDEENQVKKLKRRVKRDLIDEFILAATTLVFPGEINPRDVISRLQQGEDFSDISYDYGMTDASLMEEIERARKYYAPYADYWDNHRDMKFEEVSEKDIDPDETEEANENEPFDDESEDDDVPF